MLSPSPHLLSIPESKALQRSREELDAPLWKTCSLNRSMARETESPGVFLELTILLITLLGYNPWTIKPTHLKHTLQRAGILRGVPPSPTSNFTIFPVMDQEILPLFAVIPFPVLPLPPATTSAQAPLTLSSNDGVLATKLPDVHN